MNGLYAYLEQTSEVTEGVGAGLLAAARQRAQKVAARKQGFSIKPGIRTSVVKSASAQKKMAPAMARLQKKAPNIKVLPKAKLISHTPKTATQTGTKLGGALGKAGQKVGDTLSAIGKKKITVGAATAATAGALTGAAALKGAAALRRRALARRDQKKTMAASTSVIANLREAANKTANFRVVMSRSIDT